MVLEHGLALNSQLRAIAGLEHGLVYGDLTDYLTQYLLSCLADGKADSTLDHYRRRILNYIHFAKECNLPSQIKGTTAQDIRLYLAHNGSDSAELLVALANRR